MDEIESYLQTGLISRLKLIVDDAGSNRRFARSVGCSEGTIRSILKGDSYPGAILLMRIGAVYGISFDWLFLGKGKRLLPLAEVQHLRNECVDKRSK